MQGRRREDHTPVTEYEPGDYGLKGTRWWVMTPSGVLGHLDQLRWTITEHDDGTISAGDAKQGVTITVNPSIDVPSWHGFLEHGVWRLA